MDRFQSKLVFLIGINLYNWFGQQHKLTKESGTIFKTLNFLSNLQIRPISESDRPLQAFPAKCSLTLQLIWPIRNLQKI